MAGERHERGVGTAWERHAICESDFIHILKRFLLRRRAQCLAKSTSVYVCLCVGGGGGEWWGWVFLVSNFEPDDPSSRKLLRKNPNAVIPRFLKSVIITWKQ